MRMIFTSVLMVIGISLTAQCDFEVAITPSQIDLLCPGEEVTLMSGIFDSYQWFIDGEPVNGATNPSHTVTWYESGAPYTVEVTLDGCTEMSEEVWVDGHNWGFPWISQGGDEPVSIGPNGEPIMCEGQVLELGMSPAFVVVNWLVNGSDIPGAEEQTLIVTESGVYSAVAFPEVCPSLVDVIDVAIDVTFLETQQPTIMMNDDELCAFPLGISYTWYLNGAELIGETDACIVSEAAGAYTVYVDQGLDCQVISEPHMSTGVNENASNRPWTLYPNPTNGTLNIAMEASISNGAFYSVFDIAGRVLVTGWMPVNGLFQLDLQNLEAGSYFFQAARDGKVLAPASRFTIVK